MELLNVIRMKLDTKQTENLVQKLKQLQREILQETNGVVNDLDRNLAETYERSVDELVYDQYSPEKYQRTLHLRGAHGALQRDIQLVGYKKNYVFRIDGSSRDPVDGQSWDTKAYNVEHGTTEMSVGFNRPFIAPTQQKLEFETERLRKYYIERIRGFVRKAAK